MILRPLGHLPDPDDKQTGEELGALVGSLAPFAESSDFSEYVRIVNQRGESCVGRTLEGALGTRSAIDGARISVSGAAIYAGARQEENPTARYLADRGCFPHLALRHIQEWGVCAEERWPESSGLSIPVPIDVLEAGAIAVVDGAYRAFEEGGARLPVVKAALTRRHPVCFAMPVGYRYMNWRGGTYSGLGGEASRGMHMQFLCGHRPGAFKVAGSWGLGFAESGFAWIDESVIAEEARDIIVVTLAPTRVR